MKGAAFAKELAPTVKNMEQLAAQFSDDPEQILSEPGPLESGKSYREKKAKPLLAKIVKVLCFLYRAYIELKGKYERLQGTMDGKGGTTSDCPTACRR